MRTGSNQHDRAGTILVREDLDEALRAVAEGGLGGIECHAKFVRLLRNYAFPELSVFNHSYAGPKRDLDLSNISSMEGLTHLTLWCDGLPADLRRLQKLEELVVVVGKHVQLPTAAPHLQRLTLRKYTPGTLDFTQLPSAPHLQYLGVLEGGVVQLDGIERFPALEEVQLAYLTKLVQVSPLVALPTLRTLRIHACSHVSDIPETLRRIQSLEFLEILNKSLPSIGFLADLPALQEVNLGDTNVVDGDLSPLLRVPKVNFINRKHYSHTRAEEKVLNEHGLPGIKYGPMIAQRR